MAGDATSKPGWLGIFVDYGPLLVFLGVYKLYAPDGPGPLGEVEAVVRGTVAFMLAAALALAFSRWRFGRVSPMLWLSTGLILMFGALTVWLRNEAFIQVKPTVIYALFGFALLVGWSRGTALLQILLETAFEGLDRTGWLKLSRNWGVFFLLLAALNEALRASVSFESWLWAKLWVFLPATFLFTFSQIPMLLRHGLAVEDATKATSEQPPTGS